MSYPYHRAGHRKNGQRGVTLIEMLVVVAIIGLIAGIAYPRYARYLERSLRTDAHAGLLQAAAELERCYAHRYSYANCAITVSSPDDNYTLSVVEGSTDDGGFLLSAITSQQDGCAHAISLNAWGERLPRECW